MERSCEFVYDKFDWIIFDDVTRKENDWSSTKKKSEVMNNRPIHLIWRNNITEGDVINKCTKSS